MQLMARALVLGGNGFIGSHLADFLADSGHEVSVFDRFSGSTNFVNSSIRTIKGDFFNDTDLRAALDSQDYIFHFLSTSNPFLAESQPAADIKNSISRTVKLLEFCTSAKPRKFIFASTGGAIYGETKASSPFTEDSLPLPISPYAIGKLAVEHYMNFFRKVHGLNCLSLRISNPYGSRQKSGKSQGLIPISLERVISGEPVTKFGDGSMSRDYIFIDDLVKMISNVGMGDNKSSVYNLGSGQSYTVNEVFRAIEEVVHTPMEVLQKPQPSSFVQDVVLDISRYVAEFGTLDYSSLLEGIQTTYNRMVEGE